MGEVGREIRRLRAAKGWGQTKLAAAADMAVSGVSQIENGHRNPNSATLIKLARALGVEAADLFPRGPEPSLFEDLMEKSRVAQERKRESRREWLEGIDGLDDDGLRRAWRELAEGTDEAGTAGDLDEVLTRQLIVSLTLQVRADKSPMREEAGKRLEQLTA